MQYICLLRGISPMNAPATRLRAAFEALAFRRVQTVLSSGNVIFESDEASVERLEAQIETQLVAELGLKSIAIIRSAAQLARLVESAPFGGQAHSRTSYLTVTFLKYSPAVPPEPFASAGGITRVIGYNAENQALCAINNPLVTRTPDFMSQLEKRFGRDITTRTWNTIVKLHQRASQE
ncbi:MAG TPA: DUF1697 domain-containing protein [Candidatus Saccharimonadia bacterium]|nr:DUF1697 domain-containing protein [Candidatus Saccharimonadia bacterium]